MRRFILAAALALYSFGAFAQSPSLGSGMSPPTGLSPIGNASNTAVIATGGTTSIALKDRWGNRLTVVDLGATATSSDNTTAFNALRSSLNNVGGGVANIPIGNWNITGAVTSTGNSMFWSLAPGATLNITGSFDADTNQQITSATRGEVIMATSTQTNAGTYPTLSILTNALSIAGTNHTETTGLYVQTVQRTASTSSGVNEHDASALTFQCINAVAGGWCYLADPIVSFGNGFDGYTPGIELLVNNSSGVDSGAYGSTNAKLGLHLLAGGTNLSSDAIVINQSAGTIGKWRDGILFQTAGLNTNAFRENNGSTDIATLDASGNFTGQSFSGLSFSPSTATCSTGNYYTYKPASTAIGWCANGTSMTWNSGSALVLGTGSATALNSSDVISAFHGANGVGSITLLNNNSGSSAQTVIYLGNNTASTEASLKLNGGANTSGAGANSLTISAGGAIAFGSTAFTANGSVATAMSSLGPAGSHTTIQEWFTITDSGGTVRYIPAF